MTARCTAVLQELHQSDGHVPDSEPTGYAMTTALVWQLTAAVAGSVRICRLVIPIPIFPLSWRESTVSI